MTSTTKRDVILGGRKFELSCLPFCKNRIVVPAVSFALKAINRAGEPLLEPLSITAVDYIYLAVFEAVNFVDPKVTREEFDKWGLSIMELCSAMKIVALQTGVLVQADGQGGASGEA